jgi:hypothetical protein
LEKFSVAEKLLTKPAGRRKSGHDAAFWFHSIATTAQQLILPITALIGIILSRGRVSIFSCREKNFSFLDRLG